MLHRKPLLQKDYSGRCGNCHAYIGTSKFCVYCGTKAGEGAFRPYEENIQCVYGPPPMEREYTCSVCGYVWKDCAMIDRVKYCSECGGTVTAKELGYPWQAKQLSVPGARPLVQPDADEGTTISFGKVNQNAGGTEEQSDTGSAGDCGYDGLPSDQT